MSKADRYATFFSWTRFSPSTLAIFVLLSIMALLLFKLKFWYVAPLPLAVALLILYVKSMEVIKIEKIEPVQIVGKKCYVIKEISNSELGVVKLFRNNGKLSHETWSATTNSGKAIREGTTARVDGMRGIQLIVEQDLP